jgi:TonB family protein
MRRGRAFLVACGVASILSLAAPVSSQESLAAARQLYASAEYTTALAMLNGLLTSSPPADERQSIELFRVLCLFAVDQVDDANTAIREMLLRDPMYRPSMEEVPRRLRTAFSDARKRFLPSVIEQKYADAKTAFDREDFKAAAEGFTQVMMALSDPDLGPAAQERPLADMRALASGFNELAIRAIAPPRAPDAAVPAPAPAPASPADLHRIYDASDGNVRAPVIVRQDFPAFSGPLFVQTHTRLEVVIDETGAVESATIMAGLNPRYNAQVLTAARFWRYQPATVDGVPVKFRKRIQITLPANR